jgi:hypothetical protein
VILRSADSQYAKKRFSGYTRWQEFLGEKGDVKTWRIAMPKAAAKRERRGRPATGRAQVQHTTVRIPQQMYEAIANLAEAETRTINGEIVQLLKEALAARQPRA